MLLEISQFTETITKVSLPCNKCGGSGYLQQHKRIQGGICFKCDGKGTSNKTRTVLKETEQTYATEVQIMGENDSFESMFEAYQNKKLKSNHQTSIFLIGLKELMINPEELTLKEYATREGETALNFWKNELLKYSSGGKGLEPKLGCEDKFKRILESVAELAKSKKSGFENNLVYTTKHRWHIVFALKAGRYVKAEVLADYPDFQMMAAKLALQASRQYQKDWVTYGVDRVFKSKASPFYEA